MPEAPAIAARVAALRGDLGELSVVQRWWLVALVVVMALPKASNFSPGPTSYAFFLVVASLVAAAPWPMVRRGRRWTGLERAALALGAWLLVSTLWGRGERFDIALGATVLAVLTALLAWRVVAAVDDHDSVLRLVAWTAAAALAGTLVAAGPLTWMDHPRLIVLRPAMPIGGASSNAVGLLLVLAGLLVGVRRCPRPWFWWLLIGVDLLLVLQSLSRAGWLVVTVFGAIELIRHSGRVATGLAGAATVVVGGTVTLLMIRGPSVLVDPTRWDSYGRGLATWGDGGPATLVLGRGAGTVWAWLSYELAHTDGPPDSYLRTTSWGELLYHPHSLPVGVLVERGLVGLTLLVLLMVLVVHRCLGVLRTQRDGTDTLALALLVGLPAMLVEYYLLRGFPSALLWWFVVWAVAAPVTRAASSEKPERNAVAENVVS